MRIYLQTSPNTELIPFNYQPALVGAFHKWLGPNRVHDKLSLYSLSGLPKKRGARGGLDYPTGARLFIGAADKELIKQLVNGIQQDPRIAYGMEVQEVTLREAPPFGSYAKFYAETPVFIQRNVEDRKQFYYYYELQADRLMTETMNNKLKKAGLGHLEVVLRFDRSCRSAKKEGFTYNGIHNIGSLCPVIVEGDPEAVAFAWTVGVGNGTGIGFGAVR